MKTILYVLSVFGCKEITSTFFFRRCQMNNIPICLMYGKEDPWVKPIWGLQVKQQVPEAPYYEISPAGHCPHDEVPEVSSISLISTELSFYAC